MSHYCDFCQMEHSSSSCYHPGRLKWYGSNKAIADLERRLAACQLAREEAERDAEKHKARWMNAEATMREARSAIGQLAPADFRKVGQEKWAESAYCTLDNYLHRRDAALASGQEGEHG